MCNNLKKSCKDCINSGENFCPGCADYSKHAISSSKYPMILSVLNECKKICEKSYKGCKKNPFSCDPRRICYGNKVISSEKVFCESCKSYKHTYDLPIHEIKCGNEDASFILGDAIFQKSILVNTCMKINKNNDCKFFSQK